VNLHVLLEVGGGCEGFAAFIADEWLLLRVDAAMSVEIGFLVESLVALVEVALERSGPAVDQFMSF
jgi:hypothetical protein